MRHARSAEWAGLAAMLAAALASAQPPAGLEMHHLYTFGSAHGIHPPRILNRKPGKALLGEPENRFGLVYPVAVTTDLKDRVWIADSGTGSVHVFDHATGEYREIRRLADYTLQRPGGLASDDQGRVYLTDAGSGGVYVFDEHGEFDHNLIKRKERLLESPAAIALARDNRTIYVADPPRHAIVALNREGEVNTTITLPPDLGAPLGIAVITNQLYVLGDRHRIGILSLAGRERGELKWDDIRLPSAFAFDSARRRFVAANPRWATVQIFDEEGRNLGVFGGLGGAVDQLRRIDFLHIDRNGLIYVVDSREGKVLVFGEGAGPSAVRDCAAGDTACRKKEVARSSHVSGKNTGDYN